MVQIALKEVVFLKYYTREILSKGHLPLLSLEKATLNKKSIKR